ncbi:MAG: phage major capsid protein, partial [Planctomycetes bacterium]|nr:phage major capsid protein [Planctomycetota bacterium]
MEQQLKEKREALGVAWKIYTTFRDSLTGEESTWSADDKEKFDRLDADVDKLETEIDDLSAKIERQKKDDERDTRFHQTQNDDDLEDGDLDSETRTDAEKETAEKREEAFEKSLRLMPLTVEERAFQVDSDIEGGYLTAPQKFITKLLKNVDRAMPVRGMATKHRLPKAESLGVCKLDTDAEDWDWTTELLTGNEEDTMRFGKREMTPHPIAKRIKISKTLMRKSLMSASDILIGRMKYKLGYTMESAYMTGTGAAQPLGLFVASSDGIS